MTTDETKPSFAGQEGGEEAADMIYWFWIGLRAGRKHGSKGCQAMVPSRGGNAFAVPPGISPDWNLVNSPPEAHPDRMESHEVMKGAFARTSPKAVAADLQVSLSLVYKWAQPSSDNGSGSRNPLDRVKRLMELTRDPRIIQWLCQQAGGHFVTNPEGPRGVSYEIETGTNEIVHQFAELLGVITLAAADRTITKDESERIRDVWDRLKSITEGFVRCCEEGDFDRAASLARSARPPGP